MTHRDALSAAAAWVDWAQVVAAVFAVVAALAIPITAYFRRPSLRLLEAGVSRHSAIEAGGFAYLRLTVENKPRRRAARSTRVHVEGYRRVGEAESELVSLGHPMLGWPSAGEEADEGAVTVYSGTSRPIGLGHFVNARRGADGRLVRGSGEWIASYAREDPEASWHLLLDLHNLDIRNDRDKLPPGDWLVRLLVGAADGDARRYDVQIAWTGDAPDASAVLSEALERLHVEQI